MIIVNNLNIDSLDYDDDNVYIQQGKQLIQISRVVISRINALFPEDDEVSD